MGVQAARQGSQTERSISILEQEVKRALPQVSEALIAHYRGALQDARTSAQPEPKIATPSPTTLSSWEATLPEAHQELLRRYILRVHALAEQKLAGL